MKRSSGSGSNVSQNCGANAGFSRVGQMLPSKEGDGVENGADVLTQLLQIQHRCGSVTSNDMQSVAAAHSVSPVRAYEIASFYSMIELGELPAGQTQHVLRLCDGPACCLRGAQCVRDQIDELARQREDVLVTRTIAAWRSALVALWSLTSDSAPSPSCYGYCSFSKTNRAANARHAALARVNAANSSSELRPAMVSPATSID